MTPCEADMSVFTPSVNIAELRESATIAVSARAKAMRASGLPVIDLGAGEPDQATPEYVMSGAHRALDAGATRYTAVEGIAALRDRIAARAAGLHGHPIAGDQVVVSSGTKQALFNACFCIFGQGDDVLVPTPAWPSYYEILSLARANPMIVRGSPAASFKPTVDDLRDAATERTRGIIVNSPCNPTGAVYSRAELEAIASLADQRGWWIISDEIYREIAYAGTAVSMLQVAAGLDRVIVVDGVAKAFAMPGWRIGWSVSSRAASRAMAALQSHVTSNAATISQHAALAALSNPEAESTARAAMLSSFRRRRDDACAILRAMKVEFIEPAGAFYLFVKTGNASPSDPEPGTRFASALLESKHVAVVPGVAFHAPEWIRLSYAAADADVLEGVRRITELLRA
jgi:aspartate aminotransferase